MQITYPKFTNMIPTVEDIQLIVDSLRESDKDRVTKDGIFNPGIVGVESDYLSEGSVSNSIKIKPFIAYTQSGNRIEVYSEYDGLFPKGSSIPVTDENIVNNSQNIPIWKSYTISKTNLNISTQSQTINLAQLGRGSVLHGIKLRASELFTINDSNPEVYISLGLSGEPEKFLPPTLISEDASDISVMNLMYSLSDTQTTEIVATITGSVDLSTLTQGTLQVYLCVANLSGYDNSDIDQVPGGYRLETGSSNWLPNMTYHIVARYNEIESNPVSLNYKDEQGNIITTPAENTRVTENVDFFALRKSGSVIDTTTSNDVKLGEVITDNSGNLYILLNDRNHVDYLTLPSYRIENLQKAYLNRITNCILTKTSNLLTYTLNNTESIDIIINPTGTLLIPNGISILDGTLNNIEFDLSKTFSLTPSTNGSYYVIIRNKIGVLADISSFVISDTEPNDETSLYWFNTKENQWYYRENSTSNFEKAEIGLIGEITYSTTGGITSAVEYPIMQLVTKKELLDNNIKLKEEVDTLVNQKIGDKLNSNLTNVVNTNDVGTNALNNNGIITVAASQTIYDENDGAECQFCRVHSDGWIEQGGLSSKVNATATVTITFKKSFKDTNYIVIAQAVGSYANRGEANNVIIEKKVNEFTMQSGNYDNNTQFNWYACGF